MSDPADHLSEITRAEKSSGGTGWSPLGWGIVVGLVATGIRLYEDGGVLASIGTGLFAGGFAAFVQWRIITLGDRLTPRGRSRR